ncbi:MAG: hypothetical protein JO332_17795 [Planctomycetaceae bacterium]|nr:hypothetical protein [Planctomycetaceae bacterium]
MRRTLALLLLTSCADVPPPADREDPAALARLLRDADPDRREEGVSRLAVRGLALQSIPPLLEEDTDSLRAGVEEALAEPAPERMVWRAYHRLRLGCLAREPTRVSSALRAQGFRLLEIYEPREGLKFTRYLVRAAAYVNGAGNRHDLFCWTQAARSETEAWAVREVYVGLHVAFDAPFRTVASIERYPRGSVLARFFELPELSKVAAVFPLLEEIELTYGRIRDRREEGAPAGFHVNAGFVMEGKAGGRSVYYSAEGGLDPREGPGGRLERDSFLRRETIGPLLPRGSGVWGAGGLKPTPDD